MPIYKKCGSSGLDRSRQLPRFFGEVIGIHIDDSVLTDEGLVDIRKMGVISRLGYNDYARVDAESVFSMERPEIDRPEAK